MSEKSDPESVLASIGALDAPAVTAAKMLGGLIAACRGEDVHRTRAEVDLRAIQDIQRKLQVDPRIRRPSSGCASWRRAGRSGCATTRARSAGSSICSMAFLVRGAEVRRANKEVISCS